jgi:outer membrane protein assembly factor BamB
MLAAAWGSPLIVDGKVYIGDEDGDVTIFKLSEKKEILSRDEYGDVGPINMGNSVYSTPIISDNVLYITNKTHLFAIVEDDQEVSSEKRVGAEKE